MQIEAIPMLINSDFLNAPLDVKLHLADYKMHGKKSYVFQIKDLLHGIYECTYISMNDQDINGEALDYLLKNNRQAGEVLTQIVDLEGKDTFKTLGTMTAIANNTAAMTAVLNSSTAIAAIANSSTAMTAIANNTAAMTAVLNSSTAIAAIANSSTAMTAIANNIAAMTAVLNSSTAIAAITNSSTAMTAIANNTAAMIAMLKNGKIVSMIFRQKYSKIKSFILALNKSKESMQCLYDTIEKNNRTIFKLRNSTTADNMDVLSSYGNIENTIILCALGGNGVSWATSTLLINDEIIQTSNISNPRYVDRNNINAVGVPKATFTGYSSPVTSIAVYELF